MFLNLFLKHNRCNCCGYILFPSSLIFFCSPRIFFCTAHLRGQSGMYATIKKVAAEHLNRVVFYYFCLTNH